MNNSSFLLCIPQPGEQGAMCIYTRPGDYNEDVNLHCNSLFLVVSPLPLLPHCSLDWSSALLYNKLVLIEVENINNL